MRIRLIAGAWQIRAIERDIRPSAAAVAEAAGIPRTTMYRMVRGKQPSSEAIAALMDTLDCPFERLFERVRAE
jgi:predicted transcriptional regulator